jgi:hypothetical protein
METAKLEDAGAFTTFATEGSNAKSTGWAPELVG